MKSSRAKAAPQRKFAGLSNLLFVFLGMALMAPLVFLKPALARRVSVGPPQKPKATAISTGSPLAPWGQLDYSHFVLRQPDPSLPDSCQPVPAAEWHFKKMTAPEVTSLFNSVETSQSARRLLLDTNRWQISHETVIVRPTSELLLSLGQPARQRIYGVLATSPINMPQFYPFRFRADGFERWFAQSQLAPDKLHLVRSLTYTNRSGALCLADLDVLQKNMGTEDFRRLFESLYSEQSLFLSLRLKPSADLEGLAQYWGNGGREPEVLALLKSVVKSGGGSIDIAYLLPPFARMRLYKPGTAESSANAQDCFWTSLNFSRSETEAQVVTGQRSLEILMTVYAETLEPPRLGDVIVLLENRKPVHACVHIADDVVFTKNGVNHHQAWVLMKMNDVLSRYATDGSMSFVVLRRKTT